MATNYRNHEIISAAASLASVCDGAASRDRQGYNGYDAVFIKDILSRSIVTLKQLQAVHKTIRKYTNQLEGLGVVYSALSLPQEQEIIGFSCEVVTYGIICRFAYNDEIIAVVKNVTGRRWDAEARVWSIPHAGFPTLIKGLDGIGIKIANAAEIEAQSLVVAAALSVKPAAPAVSNTPTAKLVFEQVQFRFPYNEEVKNTVKEAGCSWKQDGKYWSMDIKPENATKIQSLLKKLGGYFVVDPNIEASVEGAKRRAETNLEASSAQEADLDVKNLRGELRPFQKAGVKYFVENKSVLMADEMGLGKSFQALAALEHVGAFPALVICPASLIYNWKKEVEKWLNRSVVIFKKGMTSFDAEIVIVNYDMLKHVPKDMRKKAIIVDECHRIKNKKAQRTKIVSEFAKDTEYRFLLSGTPMMNRPSELISQLEVLGKMGQFGGFWKFTERYCNPKIKRIGHQKTVRDISGASNLDELKLSLRRCCMIRRDKKDVLKELPDKQATYIPVAIDNRTVYQKAAKDLIAFVKEKAKQDAELLASIEQLGAEKAREMIEASGEAAAMKAKRAEVLVGINSLRQLAAKGKITAVSDWLDDFLGTEGDAGTEKKLVMFTYHKDVLYAVKAKLDAANIKTVVFCGDNTKEERDAAVEAFQNDPDTRVFLGTLAAGGEGITLTAASDVAFIEVGWKPSEIDQAESRCHRMGQKQSVTSYFFQATDTIEDWIFELIESKKDVVNLDKSILVDVLERLIKA